MTEDDKELRELLPNDGHSWVTNGIVENEEDMPVPIYGAEMPYPEGVTSVRDMEIVEVEGPMVINPAVFKGKLL